MGKGAVSRFPELNVEEREQISRSIAQGCSARDIGRLLDRHHSTISREIERNGGPDAYRVVRAQERCDAQRARTKEHKLVTCRRLHDEVNRGLKVKWSPELDQCQARRGSSRRPRDAGVPRDDLPVAVLAGPWRAADRAHPGVEATKSQACQQVSCLVQKGKIRDMVNVSERPPEAADRAV